jgi:predicted metal-dependent hydrolase
LVREFAAAIDERPGRISLRDTVTRWGSCSPDGNLAFSWRLVLAPDSVFRYVVAHEVAHLRELNHGPRFWTLVRQLVGNSERPRAWLSHYGAGLHRYG